MDILAELKTIKADFTANKELLETVTAQATEFKTSLEAKETALADITAQLEASKAELLTVTEELTAKTSELTSIQTALAELKLKEATAEEKALDIAASVGIAPMKVDVADDSAISKEEAIAHYRELIKLNTRESANEAATYFKKHKALILKRK